MTNFKIGDKINNIKSSSVCTTYPLSDFENYKNQKRNNEITKGIVIDITPEYALLKTILVEYNNEVIAVRVY